MERWCLSAKDVAAHLRIPVPEVYYRADNGEIPYLRIGQEAGRRVFPRGMVPNDPPWRPDLWGVLTAVEAAYALHVSVQPLYWVARARMVPAILLRTRRRRVIYPRWLLWRWIVWRVQNAPDVVEPIQPDMLKPLPEEQPPSVIWYEDDVCQFLRITSLELQHLCLYEHLPYAMANNRIVFRSADVIEWTEKAVFAPWDADDAQVAAQPVDGEWAELQRLWAQLCFQKRRAVIEFTGRLLQNPKNSANA